MQGANAIRQSCDDGSSMRDAFVAGNRDFRVDPRRSLYPQFHTISDRSSPSRDASNSTFRARRSASGIRRGCPAFVNSCGAIAQALHRGPRCFRLRNEEDFLVVRVRILHLCPGRHTAHVHYLARNIRAGDQPRFSRHRNSVRIISFGRLDRCRRGSWRR